MKIAYLGFGAWGYCLANMLAKKGYDVTAWTSDDKIFRSWQEERRHPLFPDIVPQNKVSLTLDLEVALQSADLIVESVTSAGVRPVFQQVREVSPAFCPIVLTSKGIEQDTGLVLEEVVVAMMGEGWRPWVGCISGPSYADDVIRGMPTSVVGSAYDNNVMRKICEVFQTGTFRVYPNSDLRGVAFGGALKNIIAIACGIADGMNLGHSSKAALMTRGLHEMKKLAVAAGCRPETLYGLSGMGDLCVTCSGPQSRNFRFGVFLAKGFTLEEAKKKIGMVVEGAYTCVSALQLSRRLQIPMPITECVYGVLYEGMTIPEAMTALMSRAIKEEHL